MAASVAARCVGEQGAAEYWAFHDLLMENQQAWSNNRFADTFEIYANQVGADVESYNSCLANNGYEAQIEAEMQTAVSRGIRSTPSFLINDQPLIGAQPFSAFEQAVAIIGDGGQFAEVEPTPAPRVAPDPVEIDISEAAITYGDPDAPVTIVEFTDFQCPYCARHATQTKPAILNDMVASGQVHYVMMDFPIEQIHPFAIEGAVAARCAGEQGYFDEMHDALFVEQAEWQNIPATLNDYFVNTATALGMDEAAFAQCLTNGAQEAAVNANFEQGTSLGITGTPAFFINGYPVSGAQPFELFEYAVDLAEIGRLAEAYTDNPPPPVNPPPEQPSGPVTISEADAFVLGSPDAPITIVEFTDYQCPFCARHNAQTLPLLLENYVETGVVRYVFKDFPLETIHPQAVAASQAARCAGEQDSYLPMHDLLFANQNGWSGRANLSEIFTGYATELGLDDEAFQACFDSGRWETAVLTDLEEGISLGVTGTPTFFFNGFLLSGAQPYEVFEQAIGQLLEQENE